MTILLKQLSVFSTCIFMLGAMIGMSNPAYADQKQGHYKQKHYSPGHYKQKHYNPGHSNKRYGKSKHSDPYVINRGRHHSAPSHRWYRYRNVNVVRHYGPLYRGYGNYHLDDDAYPWLAFTAITLKILDNFNEGQQRAHESAQVRASSAPIGETITWNQGGASGSVTPVRDGISTSGRYCREFQHAVKIGGRSERAYGTACRQNDGSWEVISSSSR